jgi:DNA-binding IclR family transcriptional regulator
MLAAGPLTLKEVAMTAAMAPRTALRELRELTAAGYVERLGRRGEFRYAWIAKFEVESTPPVVLTSWSAGTC